jgi:2,5-furandicarboxylate decarboxylase 1
MDRAGQAVQAAWPAVQDLRSWLGELARRGELRRVRSPITADRDVAAVLEYADGRHAVLFSDVRDADFPLAGNLVLDRAHLAHAMGCAPHHMAERYLAALQVPRPCRVLPPTRAAVFAHALGGDELLSLLPLTVQHDGDAGRYLTSALVVVRDPASGRPNLSINRMMAAGERSVRTLVLPGRLRQILAETERQGHNLDVAIVIGFDPLLGLASQAPADRGADELEVASALRSTPLATSKCPLTGLPVPADAEFVLEGRFLAGVREMEGPFGEFPRTYGDSAPAPVIELSAAWHRDSPVFQTILSGGREHFLLGAIPREAALLRALRLGHPGISAVRLPESGSCRFQAVVALRDPAPGEAVSVLAATMGMAATVKHVVVTDDDVDIFDDEQVGWAIATRVQADRDVVVLPGAQASSLDPSARHGTTAKLGIDATVPREERARYARMRVSPADPARVARYLEEISQPCEPYQISPPRTADSYSDSQPASSRD